MPKNLIAEYRRIASLGSNFRGLSVLSHWKEIGELVTMFGVRTILDFGSGAGDQYQDPHNVHRRWGLQWHNIRLYDPAFPGINERPKDNYDMVISSDVLEHIRKADVPEAIDFMFKHSRKIVWASVCCREAKKLFDDGTNMHVTIEPVTWWREQFEAASERYGDRPFVLEETP
jgi:hypothetical protein